MNNADIELLFGEEQEGFNLEEMLMFPEEVELALEKVRLRFDCLLNYS